MSDKIAATPDGLSGFSEPERDADTAYFWDGVARGELLLARCDRCARFRAVPMPSCPYCAATQFTPVPAAGPGKLYTWTVVHRAMEETFAADVPYVIANVELDEGARIYGRLIDRDGVDLIDGLPVELVFVKMGPDDTPYWAFRPVR